MKKLTALLLALAVLFSVSACGAPAKEADQPAETAAAPKAEAPAEAASDNPVWDKLAGLGKIQAENGVDYVSLTLPAALTEEGTTQEKLDAEAGKLYTAATLNADRSVTYKMTKQQHKAMLEKVTGEIDKGMQELLDSSELSIEKVTHNEAFTSFDVQLKKDEVGLMESVAAFTLFLYGEMYTSITGQGSEPITVNFYGANGSLLKTQKSTEVGSALESAIGSLGEAINSQLGG